jgi:hypothetical protein
MPQLDMDAENMKRHAKIQKCALSINASAIRDVISVLKLLAMTAMSALSIVAKNLMGAVTLTLPASQ